MHLDLSHRMHLAASPRISLQASPSIWLHLAASRSTSLHLDLTVFRASPRISLRLPGSGCISLHPASRCISLHLAAASHCTSLHLPESRGISQHLRASVRAERTLLQIHNTHMSLGMLSCCDSPHPASQHCQIQHATAHHADDLTETLAKQRSNQPCTCALVNIP